MGQELADRRSRGRRRVAGFTIIELMIAVAIVGILAAIAYPSYQESVRKGRRGQAKADLVEAAQIAERYRTINRTYENLSVGAGAGHQIRPYSPKETTAAAAAHYELSVSGTPDQNTFKVIATPRNSQVGDRCGVLSIDHLGAKKHSTGDDGQCQFGTTGT